MHKALPSLPSVRIRTIRAVFALILREMATTYGRSPAGYFWAVLEPVAATALLTLAFSLAFKAPPMGDNFPLFYATGLLPFMMYIDINTKVSQSIQFSRPLLFYPSITYFDALTARFILNLATHIIIFISVITGIIFIFSAHTIINYQSAFNSLMMAAAFALGVGSINCFLISMFPVWLRIWTILNRPLFIISCILFTFEAVPQPYRDYLWFNPLVHIVGEMRHAFYPTYAASYVSSLYVFSISGIFITIALIFLNRFHRRILNE